MGKWGLTFVNVRHSGGCCRQGDEVQFQVLSVGDSWATQHCEPPPSDCCLGEGVSLRAEEPPSWCLDSLRHRKSSPFSMMFFNWGRFIVDGLNVK